jgi:hypothetical protein
MRRTSGNGVGMPCQRFLLPYGNFNGHFCFKLLIMDNLLDGAYFFGGFGSGHRQFDPFGNQVKMWHCNPWKNEQIER